MKELSEYRMSDVESAYETAGVIAIASIYDVYHDNKDDSHISCDDMKKVEDAIKTLYYISHLQK